MALCMALKGKALALVRKLPNLQQKTYEDLKTYLVRVFGGREK